MRRRRSVEVPPGVPWHDADGWHVGRLQVGDWGAACGERPRLPARWEGRSDGRGECVPTDFEVECHVHLMRHEIARVRGVELVMLAGECRPPWNLTPPAEAIEAAEHGDSLIRWCPGATSWFWPTENRGKPFVR